MHRPDHVSNNDKVDARDQEISGKRHHPRPLPWAGVSDQYSPPSFSPQGSTNAAWSPSATPSKFPQRIGKTLDKIDVLGAAVGTSRPTTARLYVGPKLSAILESVSVPASLEPAPISAPSSTSAGSASSPRPLFLWLKWMYPPHRPNWGWAILLQTLVII